VLHFLDPSSPISWEAWLCKTLALIIIDGSDDDDDDDDGNLEDPTAHIVIPREEDRRIDRPDAA
jgi:hypothetical protein